MKPQQQYRPLFDATLKPRINNGAVLDANKVSYGVAVSLAMHHMYIRTAQQQIIHHHLDHVIDDAFFFSLSFFLLYPIFSLGHEPTLIESKWVGC